MASEPKVGARGPEVDPAILDGIRQQAASTLHEAAGTFGGMAAAIRPISPGLKLCGPALTVRCHPSDNLTLHAALALARPGDVIVADAADFVDAGYWGEVMTVSALARGVAGLVISGGVRDVEANIRRGFPIFSLGVCMRGTVKKVFGAINVPVIVGGVTVRPGDIVVGDDDGVVVVEHERAAEVLAASRDREAKVAATMERLAAGELTIRGALLDVLAAQGVVLDG
jgi:4-hydroxy-4-methyl-2-oxoglutarate aldolase